MPEVIHFGHCSTFLRMKFIFGESFSPHRWCVDQLREYPHSKTGSRCPNEPFYVEKLPLLRWFRDIQGPQKVLFGRFPAIVHAFYEGNLL